MLKSADLYETILTPVICRKHVRCNDMQNSAATMAICTTRKSSQSGDFELLSIPAVQKTEQGFHHNQFPKFSFFQGVFHLLERYIGFEP